MNALITGDDVAERIHRRRVPRGAHPGQGRTEGHGQGDEEREAGGRRAGEIGGPPGAGGRCHEPCRGRPSGARAGRAVAWARGAPRTMSHIAVTSRGVT